MICLANLRGYNSVNCDTDMDSRQIAYPAEVKDAWPRHLKDWIETWQL